MSEKDADVKQGEGCLSPAESTFLLGSNVVPYIGVSDGGQVDAAVQPAFLEDGRRLRPRSSRKAAFRASVASIMDAVQFPEALRLKAHRSSTRASVTCFLLHGFLVLLHVIFLALYIPHVEQQLVLPLGTTSNIASTAITIVMQSFITGYAAILVLCTQRLALRRNLSLRQTLTATHDLSTSWAGLGSALVTLYRQRVVRSSLFGAISVALYLGGIAVLHVTTSTILSLQSFNGTASVSVATALAMPGAGVSVGPESQNQAVDWADASLVARLLPGLAGMTVLGLSGNMVYDVLKDTSGIGNTTVSATTFGVTCGTLAASSTTPNPDGSLLFSAGYAGADPEEPLEVLLVPMYKNSLNAVHVQFQSGQTLSQGPHMLFYTTFPILDSASTVGSNTLGVVQFDTNSTNMFTQYFGCTLSSRQQMVVIDSRTNAVLSDPTFNGAERTLWKEWQPENLNVSSGTTGDPTVDWWATAFQESQQSGNETSDYNPLPTHLPTYYSYTTLYLAEILGLSQDVAAVNQSTVSSPHVTLSQLQDALANVSAATLWTALHLNARGSPETDANAEGSAKVCIIVAQSRLNINFVPLMMGLCASCLLLALLVPLTRTVHLGPGERDSYSESRAEADAMHQPGDDPVVDTLGVLDVLWLAHRRPDLKALVAHVRDPSGERLRAAGMVKVRIASGGRGGSDESVMEEKGARRADSETDP